MIDDNLPTYFIWLVTEISRVIASTVYNMVSLGYWMIASLGFVAVAFLI